MVLSCFTFFVVDQRNDWDSYSFQSCDQWAHHFRVVSRPCTGRNTQEVKERVSYYQFSDAQMVLWGEMSQNERSPALGARRSKLGRPSILLGLPLEVLAHISLFHPTCL